MAVASLVLGIVSIALCWVPGVGLVCGILAIIFATKSARELKEQNLTDGKTTGGLVTGIIGLTFSVIYLFVWIFYIGVASCLGCMACGLIR